MNYITVEIPDAWGELVPEYRDAPLQGIRIFLDATNWAEMVGEISENYPKLAERLVSPPGGLSNGLAIAINDVLYASSEIPTLSTPISFNRHDAISIIIPFAGG